MITSLQETIDTYEFFVIPRYLFSSDCLLLIPNDKSTIIIHCIEEYQAEQSNQPEEDIAAVETKRIRRRSIQRMHHRCNGITKTTTMVYCSDFAQAFIHSISKIMSEYKEGIVIFDRYIENSLKFQTRNKRSGGVD